MVVRSPPSHHDPTEAPAAPRAALAEGREPSAAVRSTFLVGPDPLTRELGDAEGAPALVREAHASGRVAGCAPPGLERWEAGVAARGAALRVGGRRGPAFPLPSPLPRVPSGEAPDRGEPVAVAVARGYAALARSDRPATRAAAAELRALAGALAEKERPLALRIAGELSAAADAWWIEAGGARFEPPGGGWVEVGNHPAQHRVLAALTHARLHRGGQPLGVDALAAAGWPGERILRDAAANRVRVALYQLRRSGLSLIDRAQGGWCLSTDVGVRTA